MKTTNIFKTLAMAMLMPAMLLTTACSNEDIALNNTAESTAQKGYTLPVTVSVTRQGDAAGTRASFNESSKKLEFAAGDKLFVSGNNLTAGKFAGTLDYDAGTKKFSGTITTENTYTGTVDDLLAGSEADLLPKDYNPYGFLSIWDRGTAELYDDVFRWVDTKAFAKSKAEAVEQFSLEYGAYNSGTGFMLAPHKAVLNFTISGLAASTGVAVVFNYGSYEISGNVTTDGSGTVTFAIGLSKNKDLNSCSLKVGGNAITLVSESKTVEAGKIYNITRSAVKTLAEATPEDVGKIAGKDGKIYATKAAAEAVATGNAVAMIAYVGGAGSADASSTTYKGLALALEDVSGAKAWCFQTSKICLTNRKSSEPDAKGDMAGIANTDALVGHTHTHAAAKAAREYSVTRPDGTSAWFLPSAGQWHKMATAAGGYANLKTNAGLQNYYYWTSSECDYYRAWKVEDDQDQWWIDHKDYENYVRACLAF